MKTVQDLEYALYAAEDNVDIAYVTYAAVAKELQRLEKDAINSNTSPYASCDLMAARRAFRQAIENLEAARFNAAEASRVYFAAYEESMKVEML